MFCDLIYINISFFNPFIGTFIGLSSAPKEILYQAYERAAGMSNNHNNNKIIVGENDTVSFESNVQSQERPKTSE